MRMDSIRIGDIVLVDKKGRRFHASVTAKGDDRTFAIMPINSRETYRVCTSREVVKVWKAPRRAAA